MVKIRIKKKYYNQMEKSMKNLLIFTYFNCCVTRSSNTSEQSKTVTDWNIVTMQTHFLCTSNRAAESITEDVVQSVCMEKNAIEISHTQLESTTNESCALQ